MIGVLISWRISGKFCFGVLDNFRVCLSDIFCRIYTGGWLGWMPQLSQNQKGSMSGFGRNVELVVNVLCVYVYGPFCSPTESHRIPPHATALHRKLFETF